MALRPFAKHQKRKGDDDTTPSAADEFAQFFSNDPRPDEPTVAETVPAPNEHPAPTVTMTDQSAAGWYPDSQDPGLMRYWDGFHLTGQTMRVDPARQPVPASGEDTPRVATAGPSAASSPSATDILAPDRSIPLLGSQLLSLAVDSADPVPDQPGAPDRAEPSAAQANRRVADPEGGPPLADREGGRPVGSTEGPSSAEPAVTPDSPASPASPDSPASPSVAAAGPAGPAAPAAPALARMANPVTSPAPEPRADGWAERTEQAVMRARAAGTPEAWQEAAEAAAVVAEMALTMQLAADVRQSAEQLAGAAEEAQRKTEEAEELAAEAQRAVQRTAQVAKEAADAAAAAARAATEAKQKAERATEAMPRMAARSNDAAQAAASARRRAQLVEEIVSKAHRADTPEAWSEAHRGAERAIERDPREAQVAGS